jgi:predicted secreted hydrolase
MKVLRWSVMLIFISGVAGWLLVKEKSPSEPPAVEFGNFLDTGDFQKASGPGDLQFPADHAPHDSFQTEWWYFTGNLESGERTFGYQLTFFRRGLGTAFNDRSSNFAADQIYFAHFAITDPDGIGHREYERYSRAAAGLAGSVAPPLAIWVEDWRMEAVNLAVDEINLSAVTNEITLDLNLRSLKEPTLHGVDGLSAKSNSQDHASFYVSQTRMQTTGMISVDGEEFIVQGESWFDHEWSTSVLDEKAVGWDWFGLHLDDGRDLMLFHIRNEDGSVNFASGTLVEPDGETWTIREDQLEFEVLDSWISPSTQAEYPSEWRVLIPDFELDLKVTPILPDQEMNLTIVYWEGAVEIEGLSEATRIGGRGYMELTGYLRRFFGTF